MLTQSELQRIWHYCPDSGRFTRLVATTNRVKVGDIANCHNNNGYIRFKVSSKDYTAHRLAWLYMTGHFPNAQIDHINGVRDDNRYCNLRDATGSINQQNKRAPMPGNTSGFLGVSWENFTGKWKAQIKINSKMVTLGRFDDPRAAAERYLKIKRKYHIGCTI